MRLERPCARVGRRIRRLTLARPTWARAPAAVRPRLLAHRRADWSSSRPGRQLGHPSTTFLLSPKTRANCGVTCSPQF